MVLLKKFPCFQFFFLGNIGQENVFCVILERKNPFLSYKNKKFKSRKIDIFLKGLTHIPSDMCFPTFETHIPCDVCSPPRPPWETHISIS